MTIKSPLLPAFLWIAAFICALYPVNDWQLWLFPISIALLFVWSFSLLSQRLQAGWEIPRSPVLVLAGAFTLLVVASVFWSEVKPVSLVLACLFIAMPVTFFSGVIAWDNALFAKIAKALAVIFALLSLWAIFQYFFLNAYVMGQARHPLADPSSFGALLLTAFFCAFGWLLSERPEKERRFALALCILLVCGVASTVARGPVLAFVPGFALVCWLLWPRVVQRRKQIAIIALAAFAFYGLTQTGVQRNFDLGQRLFKQNVFEAQDLTNNRMDVWASSIDMIKDRPLLGTGFGTFFLYYPEYRKATEEDGVRMAHNDPMQYFVELGVLGPLLFYAFVLACVVRSFRSLNALEGDRRVIVASILAALTALVATSHLGFSLYNLSILLLAGFLLAVWFRVSGTVLNDPVSVTGMPPASPMALNKVLLALPYILTGWLLFGFTAGEYYAGKASQNLFKEQMFEFADNINNAGRVSFDLNTRAYLLAVNVPMSILDFEKDKQTEEAQKKLYDQIRGYMQRVLAVNPRAASAYYYLAKVQTMVAPGIVAEGTPPPEEYYKKAIALDPTHMGARMALYRLYKEQGKSPDELIAIMEPGLRLTYVHPLAGDYYAEISRLYLDGKDYGKAKEAMMRGFEFKKRSDYSLVRQNTSLPQAIIGGDAMFPEFR